MKNNQQIIIVLVFSILLALFLSSVFSGRVILPQYFSLGPVTIRYYGITIVVAILAAYYLAMKRRMVYGIENKDAENIIFWTIIGGFLGARVYHVFSSFGFYLHHPLQILQVWKGGLSIYGALIGGVTSIIICHEILNLKSKILNLFDWLAPSLLLGQIIGRFGNMFNYEAFGYPTNLPWKMFVPIGFRPENLSQSNYFHPLFLYEALGNAIILFFLLRYEKKMGQSGYLGARPGRLFFIYLLLYNILRFCLEFLRVDSTFIGMFRLNSITSFVLVLISLGFLLFNRRDAKIS